MSISNPSLKNPCTKFIDFKSDKGKFYYYDKQEEKNVEIPLPLYFVVLDELSIITGYNKKHDCGIYSNEVRNVNNDILRVKTFKGGESVTGTYPHIKDTIKAMGGKFTKSVYALKISKDEQPEMVNFKFKGGTFSAWLDVKAYTENSVIGVRELKKEKNGNNEYLVPVFKFYALSKDILEEAVEMDKVLQKYLKEYFNQVPEKEIAAAEAESDPDPEVIDQEKVEAALSRYKASKLPEDDEEPGVPEDDPDLPF